MDSPNPDVSLPRFLLGESLDGRLFVTHLEFPRFAGEIIEGEEDDSFDIEPSWIDDPGFDADPAIAEKQAEELLQEAADFYLTMVSSEDDIEDDEY